MRVLSCVLFLWMTASGWADDPPALLLPDASIVWNNGDNIGMTSTGGFFNVTRAQTPGQLDQLNISVISALSNGQKVNVANLVFVEDTSGSEFAQPWEGTINGEAVNGKLFVYAVDPDTNDFLFHWHAVNGANVVLMDVTVTMTPGDAQEFGEVLMAAASWPYVVLCGCKNGPALAACPDGGDACREKRTCPSGYTGKCGWIIRFYPWPWLTSTEGFPFPEQPIEFPPP